MNKIVHTIILFFAVALVLSSSCNKKEGCTNPNAENFDPTAEREDGTCIGQRAKFIGLYQVSESCGTGVSDYLCEIKASNITLDDILIFNLSKDLSGIDPVIGNTKFENPVVANIINSKFTFDKQAPDGDGWYVLDGKGTINGNIITMSYRIKYGDGNLPPSALCTSAMTK